jgi:protein phosphatase
MKFLKRLLGQAPTKPKPEKTPETTEDAAPTDETVDVAEEEKEDAEHAAVKPERQQVDTIPPIFAARQQQGLIETAPLQQLDIDAPVGTHQLPIMEEVEAFNKSALSFGYAIDIGQTRAANQDALVAHAISLRTAEQATDFGLFAVADGMGGHLDGEKASALVTTTIAERVIDDIYLHLLRQPSTAEHITERVPVSEILMRTLQEANRAILEQIPGSGTTATVTVTLGNKAYFAHIGDSRAYLITPQNIEQITRDHSLAQRLYEVGQLTKEEMGSFPRRNELYKVVGFTDDMEPDLNTRHLPPGAFLLICSDGLWGEVPEIIMQDVVLTAKAPHEACQRLVNLANERGGHDNISVVIVQIPTTEQYQDDED